MVTPYKSVPFEVIFTQRDYEFSLTHFYTSEMDAYNERDLVRLKENVPLTLRFDAPESARFYMDGLDALPAREVEIDKYGIAYISPHPRFALFKSEYYPFIPGHNLITIMVEDTPFYSLIEIIPTQMTTFQWQSMVEGLEQTLQGLSMDLIRKNLGIGQHFSQAIPTILLYRFMIIQKSFPNVMAALSDLLNKVNYRIRKEYQMIPFERARVIDAVTIRHQSTHPENTEQLMVPKREIDYDLPENRWIKIIVRVLLTNITDFVDALVVFEGDVFQEIQRLTPYAIYQEHTQHVIEQKKKVLLNLKSFKEIAEKMRKGLEMIKLAPWYSKVSDVNPTSISSVLMTDSRYFALYKLYKALRADDFEVSLDPSFSYKYKRTDKLYELWGFLQICEALKGELLGFEPISGWIYDEDYNPEHVLIPNLNSGTKLIFAKEKLALHLTYDGRLPFNSSETNTKNPLYTSAGNNTPDGRMDVYWEGVYLGSLIIDLKYRNLSNFFRENYLNQSYRPLVLNQLISYGSQCRSRYTFGSTDGFPDVNPVSEVWAIYPRSSSSIDPNDYKKDHHLRFLKLAPGDNNEPLQLQLREAIKGFTSRYKRYCR